MAAEVDVRDVQNLEAWFIEIGRNVRRQVSDAFRFQQSVACRIEIVAAPRVRIDVYFEAAQPCIARVFRSGWL